MAVLDSQSVPNFLPTAPEGVLTWPPTTATLISGACKAVLVDALYTKDEARTGQVDRGIRTEPHHHLYFSRPRRSLFWFDHPAPAVSTGQSGGTSGSRCSYGPAILSGYYRVQRWTSFQPYAGLGVAYAIILKTYDGSVWQLGVHNKWGLRIAERRRLETSTNTQSV